MLNTYFEAFRLQPGPCLQQQTANGLHQIDTQTLRDIYKNILFKIHPDQLVDALPQQRRMAEAMSADYSKAFQCLIQPLERVRYWLKLEGLDLEKNSLQPSMMFFETQMELQETFESLKESAGETSQNKEYDQSLQAFKKRLQQHIDTGLDWFSQHQSNIHDPSIQQELMTQFSQMALASRLLQNIKDLN